MKNRGEVINHGKDLLETAEVEVEVEVVLDLNRASVNIIPKQEELD